MSARSPTVPDKTNEQITFLLEKLRLAEQDIAQLRRDLAASGVTTKNLPKVRAHHSANQSINSGGWTTISLDSELFDTNGMHTTTSRLTAVTEGYYKSYAALEWASSATGYRGLRILLNGTTQIAKVLVPPVNGDSTGLFVSTTYYMNRNDYIEMQGFQSSLAALNSLRFAEYAPVLGMEMLAEDVIAIA